MKVPLAEGVEVSDIDDIVHRPAPDTMINGRVEIELPGFTLAAEDEFAPLGAVRAADCSGGDYRPEPQPAGTDQAPLPAQEDRGLIKHHSPGDVTDQ